jgi:release factor glutamine methyltransferase
MAKAEAWVWNWRGPQGLRMWVVGASQVLGAAGVMTPRFDAERLAAHALGLSWSELMGRLDEPVDATTARTLERVLTRRANGEPLAYIEGARGFYGLELGCGPGVLVPRPETETVVDVALELIEHIARPVVVDIGTGSGAIALAIASQRPDAEVVATDISEEALAYARDNAKALGLDVWFACGDLFDAVPRELHGRADLIVSNPPYVRNGTELPPDVRAEPSIALYAGPDGTEVLQRIGDGAVEWLKPGGALVLEIGEPEQADVIAGANVRNDLTARPRVVWTRS